MTTTDTTKESTPQAQSEGTAQTPTTEAAQVPIWGYELEDYIDIGTAASPSWHKVTNLLSWEVEDDDETYEPDYVDVKGKKKFNVGNSCSISYEKDAYQNNEFDEWIMDHEDDSNIPVRVMRVRTWSKGSDGAMKAKCAGFNMTPKQLDKNSKNEPIKLKGDLNMSDDGWTQGTWNGTAFTTAAE